MLKVRKKYLSDNIISLNGSEDRLFRNLKERFKISTDDFKIVKRTLQRDFLPKFKRKWKQVNRTKEQFNKKFKHWLEGEIIFKTTSTVSTSAGRPTKKLEECSERSKRRKLSKLEEVNNISIAELQGLLERKLRVEGKRDEAELVREVLSMGAHKFKEQFNEDSIKQFSRDDALALITDANLSRYQYNSIREQCLLRNADLFPSYNQIFRAKSDCYPLFMKITERGASITLQHLLDHTIKRLLLTTDVQNTVLGMSSQDLMLYSKWGCDGSSGHSAYKQNFNNPNISDESVFMASLVPLQLVTSENVIIWKNPHPSSSNYCRPIFFEFLKETPENVIDIVNNYQKQIDNLKETIVSSLNCQVVFAVHHNLSFTMIDGKICQVLTETSSSACCPICKAKPSEMNDLEKLRNKNVNTDAYKYGLSSLHALIRFMECILHISYRLDFKKWSARSSVQKDLLKNKKKRVQMELKQRLGINVDVPRQGSGNSNDGNTARRFFRDTQIVAEVTGVDEELIIRFSTVLQVLISGRAINEEAFDNYAQNTANIFVSKYRWFYMPSSIHKILLHGCGIIQSACLPIEQLSEEAAEARNKDFKKFRQFGSRKCSRVATNEDILHSLLVSSDPYLTSLRNRWKKHVSFEMSEEATKLLIS